MDTIRFIAQFSHPISESTPHLYISALPFAPVKSEVSRRYLKQWPRLLTVDIGKLEDWPKLAMTIERHKGWIASVAFSPDGNTIASGSKDKTVCIWDARTGAIVSGPFQGHSDGVNSVAFSSDGERVASSSDDRTLCVWDVRTGAIVLGPLLVQKVTKCIVFSPDGEYIAFSSDQGREEGASMSVRSARTGEVVWSSSEELPEHDVHMAFSPNGKQIVSNSHHNTVSIRDAQTGQIIVGPLVGHRQDVTSVVFTPSGHFVLSGSLDMSIQYWDASTGAGFLEVVPFEAPITALDVSSDGRLVVAVSNMGDIVIVDTSSGDAMSEPWNGHRQFVRSVKFSPDGTRIVTGSWDRTIRVWDAHVDSSTSNFWQVSESICAIAFLPQENNTVLSVAGGQIITLDVGTGSKIKGELLHEYPYITGSSNIAIVALSHDGQYIAATSWTHEIYIWNMYDGTLILGPFSGHKQPITSLAFSTNGDNIITGHDDGEIHIHSIRDGTPVLQLPHLHECGVTGIVSSSNGEHIMSRSEDNTICIWVAETSAALLCPLKLHCESVSSVAFSPDGRYMALGSQPGTTLHIWKIQTEYTPMPPVQVDTDKISAVTFSPDGNRLAIASGSQDNDRSTIRIWDVKTRTTVFGPLEGHKEGVLCIAFSPNGKYIASGALDGSIRVWDVSSLLDEPGDSQDSNPPLPCSSGSLCFPLNIFTYICFFESLIQEVHSSRH